MTKIDIPPTYLNAIEYRKAILVPRAGCALLPESLSRRSTLKLAGGFTRGQA